MVSHHSSWQLHLSAASSPETRTAGRCGFQGMKKNSTGQGSFFLPVNLCPGLSLSREFGHPGVLRGAGQRQSPPPPSPPQLVTCLRCSRVALGTARYHAKSCRCPKVWSGSLPLWVLDLGPQRMRRSQQVTLSHSDAQQEGEGGRKASSQPCAPAPGTQTDIIHVKTPGLLLPRACWRKLRQDAGECPPPQAVWQHSGRPCPQQSLCQPLFIFFQLVFFFLQPW